MDPLSPVQVEQKLRALVTEMTKAQQTLAHARDAETDAEIRLRKARLHAFHSPDLPKVVRGGTTTAERDSWLDARCDLEWQAHKQAVTQREIAQDNLRVTLAIAETVRSLGASVRSAYGMAGVG